MAQIGDFQDLLDAIKSAKSILEPSKLDVIREQAKLERRADLDIAALNILNEDIKELREKREGLEEVGTVSYLDLQKFPLSPDTGNLRKYASRKFDDVNDALDVMTQKRDLLQSEVREMKEMHAISQEQSQRLLEVKGKYKTKGAFSHVFERSDFEEAQRDYGTQLKDMKNPDGSPMYNERDIAIRLHFHNKAYLRQHAVEESAHVEAAFDLQEQKYGSAFTEWKNTASPSKAMGQSPTFDYESVPAIVDRAIFGDEKGEGGFVEYVKNNAQYMYDSGEWTVKNAPLKIVSGVAQYDESWFEQEFRPGQTRIQRIRTDMTMGIKDFLGHANTTEGFKSAINPGSASNILLTNTSQDALVPGLGYGNLIWGNQFKLMEDFYNHDTIQRHINNRVMKETSIRSRAMSIINKSKI